MLRTKDDKLYFQRSGVLTTMQYQWFPKKLENVRENSFGVFYIHISPLGNNNCSEINIIM